MKLEDNILYLVSTLIQGKWKKWPKETRTGREWNRHINAYGGDLGRFRFTPVVSQVKDPTEVWMDQVEADLMSRQKVTRYDPEPKDRPAKFRFIRPIPRVVGL